MVQTTLNGNVMYARERRAATLGEFLNKVPPRAESKAESSPPPAPPPSPRGSGGKVDDDGYMPFKPLRPKRKR